VTPPPLRVKLLTIGWHFMDGRIPLKGWTSMRTAMIERKTRETEIMVSLDLDGTGDYDVDTGIGFLDHMLEQLSRHSLIDLTLRAEGDLHIDFHHTAEDSGIAIGQAVAKALGDRKGIRRYASLHLPMDGTLTRAAIDVSGRPFLVWKVNFTAPKIGDFGAYGTEAQALLGSARSMADLGRDFGATLTEAEVRWLVTHEFARTAEDIVWRRTKLGLRMTAEQIAALDAFLSGNGAQTGGAETQAGRKGGSHGA